MQSDPPSVPGRAVARFMNRESGTSPRGEPFEPRTGLVAPTQGDAMRHMIVRDGFLKHFLQDERVQALYADWTARPGLVEQILDMQWVLEQLAAMAGVPNWRDVWDYAQREGPQEPLHV